MWFKNLVIKGIETYQVKGGSRHYFNLECNFSPTCSEYTKQAIRRFGLWRGCLLSWRRVCRCNDPDCVKIMEDPVPIILKVRGKHVR